MSTRQQLLAALRAATATKNAKRAAWLQQELSAFERENQERAA